MQSNADREQELEGADGEGKIGMMQRLAGWGWRGGCGGVAIEIWLGRGEGEKG